MNPRTPKEIFNKHAIGYQERFMHLSLYEDTYDKLCELLKPGASVLEIGCGPGNITKYLLSKRKDVKIIGIDIAENMISLAKQNCPEADFRVMDCKDISKIDRKFDAVVCGFCLPYLSLDETKKFISDARDLLTDKGILYISAIEKDHSQSGYQQSSNGEDSCMIYYYKENDLRPILETNGFVDRYVFRKNFDRDVHLVMIANRK